jgi:L-alanine-DL-glutamate epimerase-like enolase superfamily enzyme
MTTKISRVQIHEFQYEAQDIGFDAGGFDFVYVPGNRQSIPKAAVVIETADGARGEYVGLWGATPMALAQTIMLAPHLIGQDPFQREYIYDEFKRALRQYDHMGYGLIDICLWDLAGKALKSSVSRLLGGYRQRLLTYASTMHGDRNGGLSSKEAYGDFALQCRTMGYQAFKIHGWYDGNPAEEIANIKYVRRVVGDEMGLMLDPACQIRTFLDTLAVGKACDEANYLWLEDPARDNGVSQFSHQKLRQLIKTPILCTEHVRGLEPKADFVINGGTDILRADPEYDLGITGVMKIAHLAESLGLDVEVHACGPAHRHCMAAIRNTNYYELALVGPKCRNPLPEIYTCGYSDQLDCIDSKGYVPVPVGSGLGVSYDWPYIEHHRTALHEFTGK